MYKCLDCGSTNVVETHDYEGYFREGDWVRLRRILVHSDPTTDGKVIASCHEKSWSASAIGANDLEAIQNLGAILEGMGLGTLLGKNIED